MNLSIRSKNNQKALAEQKRKEEALRRIRAQEKLPFWMLMKYKYLTVFFAKKLVWMIFRFVLLVGISFVVLFPYFTKIAGSFMNELDFVSPMVKLISLDPTLDTYKAIIKDNHYFAALFTTSLLSLLAGVGQMLTCAIIGYGFAKFNFKFKKLLFLCVIFTMVIPHDVIRLSMLTQFRYFDIWGIFGGLMKLFGSSAKSPAIADLTNSFWPLTILSLTGIAFKNGLYIYMMRQYFNGVPDELEEAAYVDGAGSVKTFARIIMPMSSAMLVTIFMFAFSWQWTDMFYTGLFFTNKTKFVLMPDIIAVPRSLITQGAAKTAYETAMRNTAGLMILAPLVVVYLFAQRTLIEGVERSGITG